MVKLMEKKKNEENETEIVLVSMTLPRELDTQFEKKLEERGQKKSSVMAILVTRYLDGSVEI